ncbi:hypothetical protein QWY93_15805 [Echinicola jeungdonensis]|uniref:Uncharacterized protein n=1 Tax=Echinicola jeungdonensis TaxID=709343 RepID=A0ABV5J6W1_9BACT|nr:hypothetical protein [Echinicola jeungdonensis]MDN3670786.1 hypothetical protein [Echinicola jeungdonensis]
MTKFPELSLMLYLFNMFESPDYPKPLDEALFENWLEQGHDKKICYNYLLIIWDVLDQEYKPAYIEELQELESYERYPNNYGQEGLVAVFDLYSASRLVLDARD